MYALSLLLGPTEEPVSLEEAKAHCRVDLADDDTLIEDLIVAARETLELETARSFLTTQWAMGIDRFPGCGYGQPFLNWHTSGVRSNRQQIALPRSPVQSVDSITYLDTDGAEQTLSTDVYGVKLSEPAKIYLKPYQPWPSTYDVPGAVTINFTAGWQDTTEVPAGLKAAIRLLVGHYNEQREATIERSIQEIPLGVERLLWLYRVPSVA